MRKETPMEKKKPGRKPKDPLLKKRTTAIALTPQEQQILESLADQRGVSSSMIVGELIRKEAELLNSLAKVDEILTEIRERADYQIDIPRTGTIQTNPDNEEKEE